MAELANRTPDGGNGHMGCVNPNHLEWKTKTENAQDRLKHGNYGAYRRVLKPDQVIQIKALKGKKTQFELAEMFGVSRQTISGIQTGLFWKSVSPEKQPI